VLGHPTRGLGLRHMRERLAAIGGRLDLQSRVDGTRLVATVPDAAIRRLEAA